MQLKFTKMHGLGNDFVVFDNISQSIELDSTKIRFLADRRFGIGCDQVLVVSSADRPDVDFNYRIFNADGGEVEQCGNGARCFARFVIDKQLINKENMVISTSSGVIELKMLENGEVTVDMGIPVFEPEKIPFQAKTRMSSYNLDIDGKDVTLSAVSMGNPHAVLLVEDTETAPVETMGPLIESHERFPNRANVGFMQIVSPEQIRLRVYERGAGETLACGTGACAAVVAGILLGKLDQTVKVDLPGGRLTIQWAGDDSPVMMTGPATSVFEGTIEL